MSERNDRSGESAKILERTIEFTYALFITAILFVSCNGDQATQPQPQMPQIPSALAANMTGSWVGTITNNDPPDCGEEVRAEATFKQIGSAVTGTLKSDQGFCGDSPNLRFEGTRKENTLAGTITGGENGTAVGILAGNSLEISLHWGASSNLFRMAMHLHR